MNSKNNPAFPSEKRQQKTWRDRAWLFIPGHPNAGVNGYVLRACVWLELKLGRQLTDSEVIHFIDANFLNANPENLVAKEWPRDAVQS